jgi:hypothetical protein
MKSEWPHSALHVFIAVICVNVVFTCFGHPFICHHRLMWWLTEMYNAFTAMVHSTIQITMYHIPEDMKLQSLPLDPKTHLALEIQRIFNQNRTMENVQYMPLNTCHKPFNIYESHKQYIKNIFEYYTADTASTLHNVFNNMCSVPFCNKTCLTPKKCHMYTALHTLATCLAAPHSTILNQI